MAKFINRKSLKILEYDKILAQIANHTSSVIAKNTVLSIKPCVNLSEAQFLSNLTKQAYEILFDHLIAPTFAVDEMEDILDNASKFMTLSCADIIRVGRLLRTSRLVYNSIYKINSQNISDMKAFWAIMR